jgi:thioredoxin-dependent peroxiredoxin
VVKTVKSETKSFVGKSAPNIDIESSSGQSVNLSKIKGQKIVLYFYPKDDTPGCTIESNEFNQLLSSFKKQNCIVYGISRDSVKSHDKFICKFGYQFELLSDADEKICKYFDVIKEKNMYGKMVFGIERSTFIFDSGNKIVKEYRKVKVEGHAAEILKDVQSI